MRFRHKRTGRIFDVVEADVFRFNNARYEALDIEVPSGSVAEVLAWAGDDQVRRDAALAAEKAGKKRKGIIEALS